MLDTVISIINKYIIFLILHLRYMYKIPLYRDYSMFNYCNKAYDIWEINLKIIWCCVQHYYYAKMSLEKLLGVTTCPANTQK